MDIRNFVTNLQQVYQEIESEFSGFQLKTGITCPSGCGKCCLNPEIEATMLEMLPMALEIYDSGEAQVYLEKLENHLDQSCLVLRDSSRCDFYRSRPAICRMFGVAGYHLKNSSKTLSVCKELKPGNSDLFNQKDFIQSAPEFSQGSAKLLALDMGLISPKYKINHALKLALEKVLLYAQYNKV